MFCLGVFYNFAGYKNIFMRILFFILGLLFVLSVNAQQIDSSYIYMPAAKLSDTLGHVQYYQSEAISSIMKKKIIVNKEQPKVDGYRVQVFSVSGVNSNDKINKEKAEYLLRNKNANVYIVYQSPYFKLRIGDYRDMLQANYHLNEIIKEYPFAFIVKDKVNIPKIENDDESED